VTGALLIAVYAIGLLMAGFMYGQRCATHSQDASTRVHVVQP
jgi:hypothetical protein